jgi:hypothetical protein
MEDAMKLLCALLAAGLLLSACAAELVAPVRHPPYRHAFSELRAARWVLKRSSGGYAAGKAEFGAIWQVNAAMTSVEQAASVDGQDSSGFPRSDPPFGYGRGLKRTLYLLNNAKNDLVQEEDKPAARHLRNGSLRHLNQAIRLVEQALSFNQ